ncbi:MAG: hypothetical protein M1836_002104 [Candelina mexicana]|nr:MAG: hypothetical protein M1836_002104 [Candelina mexicana]
MPNSSFLSNAMKVELMLCMLVCVSVISVAQDRSCCIAMEPFKFLAWAKSIRRGDCARKWRGYQDDCIEGTVFPSLRNVTLDFTGWDLTPDDNFFPKILKQWLKTKFGALDSLTLQGLEHCPESVVLLSYPMIKPGGMLTVDLTRLWLRSIDPFPAPLLAVYEEGIAEPHNVGVTGFGDLWRLGRIWRR